MTRSISNRPGGAVLTIRPAIFCEKLNATCWLADSGRRQRRIASGCYGPVTRQSQLKARSRPLQVGKILSPTKAISMAGFINIHRPLIPGF